MYIDVQSIYKKGCFAQKIQFNLKCVRDDLWKSDFQNQAAKKQLPKQIA